MAPSQPVAAAVAVARPATAPVPSAVPVTVAQQLPGAGTNAQFLLPTRPLPVSTGTTVQAPVQAQARLPSGPATLASSAAGGRTIATTTLTAAQLQQLAAARGQVFVSALQGGQARQSVPGQQVARPAVAAVARAGVASPQAVARAGQPGLVVQQPRPGGQTVLQRPVGPGVVRSAQPAGPRPGGPVPGLLQPGGALPAIVRTAGGQLLRGLGPGQIVVTAAQGSSQLRQAGQGAILVSSAGGTQACCMVQSAYCNQCIVHGAKDHAPGREAALRDLRDRGTGQRSTDCGAPGLATALHCTHYNHIQCRRVRR
jgi:hypothetical protein